MKIQHLIPIWFLAAFCTVSAQTNNIPAEAKSLNLASSVDIHDAARNGDLETIKALLKSNPDLIDSRDNYDRTPLHIAAIYSHTNVAELLLAHKANVNAKDQIGRTPLFMVNSTNMAELFLANGADINAKEADGKTALRVAEDRFYRPIVDLLRQHGGHVIIGTNSTIFEAAKYGELEIVRAQLKTNPELVNSKNEGGDTPLHIAASRDWQDVAETLLSNKADVNSKNSGGWTPLHYASANRSRDRRRDIVELLLAGNAEVNAKDNKGETPLALALDSGRGDEGQEVVDLLRQHGGHE